MSKQKAPIKHKKARNQPALTFSDHIRELRRRVLWVALVCAITSSVAYAYHDQLVQVVMAPLHGQKLIYLTPGGGFNFIFQITLYAGLIASAPALMYQLYGFIRPTLPINAQRNTLRVAFFATLLMIVGVGYGYFIAVPAALTFLSTFAGNNIIPNLTADSYLNFFLSYIGGLALLFQLPLLLIFWHWARPLNPTGLLKSERLVILFSFIAAAIITPTPDIVNQTMIAGPLIGLYQIGVFIVLASIVRARRQTKKRRPTSSSEFTIPAAAARPARPSLLPSHSPMIQVTTPPALSSQPRLARTMDGFRPSIMPSVSLQPPRRSLAIPNRPLSASRPHIARHPRLSIDGISPARQEVVSTS